MRAAALSLLLLTGCSLHVRPVYVAAPHDALLAEAQQFVDTVAAKVPEWDADEGFVQYESAEIQAVKADIVRCRAGDGELLENAEQLRIDWERLVALDLILHKTYLLLLEGRMGNSKNWIEKAVSKHPGAEHDAAKRAGMSTAAYAEKNDKKPGKAGRRARLTETLMNLRPK